MKNYVTFGQDHTHRVNGKTFDRDSVATYDSLDGIDGRDKAFELFGPKFCFHYTEENWDPSSIRFFPRGYVEVLS